MYFRKQANKARGKTTLNSMLNGRGIWLLAIGFALPSVWYSIVRNRSVRQRFVAISFLPEKHVDYL